MAKKRIKYRIVKFNPKDGKRYVMRSDIAKKDAQLYLIDFVNGMKLTNFRNWSEVVRYNRLSYLDAVFCNGYYYLIEKE